ncbi:CAAX protease [Brachybacterium sp. GCM10030267]|uniref:CAAX protease n=1 Tax=Brachybacterium sp. GCM10030267 TaxID=3273381 RepID=UPI00360FFC46
MSAPPPPRPVPYHRLATLRSTWSLPVKPLLTLATAFVVYVALASVLLVLTILVLALAPGVNIALGVTSGDPTSPLDVGLALAMGALWLPAGLAGVRIGGWRPPGPTWSVAARFRRELLRPTGIVAGLGGLAVVAAAALAGALAGSAGGLVEATSPGASGADGGAGPLQLLVLTLIVLVLVPLQAVGLELTIRGVLLQALGTWIRTPVVPVLVVGALSLVGRELTVPVAIPAVALAACAAVLAWKTGGLEVPIALAVAVTVGALLVSAFAAGTGGGAGAAALGTAAAAPGTSAATLAVADSAALAGGTSSAIALVLVTVLVMALVSRREQLALLEPVGRDASDPAPDPVPF